LTEFARNEANGKDRRRVPRFPFEASAEITEIESGKKTNANTSDLSLFGCYVRMQDPPPRGTQLLIKIYTESDFFEGHATVAFSQAGVGIGLSFHDVHPHFLSTLKKWLAEAMKAMTKIEHPD